jgi:hypothetical protein
MKTIVALLLLSVAALHAVTCPSGTTHIVDTLLTGDGVTPAFGKILVSGPSSPSGSTLSTTITITIGTGGAVDFCLLGGVATNYTAAYLLTTSTGRPRNSYTETWVVPVSSSTFLIKQLWGGSAAPQYLVSPQQINPAGLSVGQTWVWDGNSFVPGTGGGSSGDGTWGGGAGGVTTWGG